MSEGVRKKDMEPFIIITLASEDLGLLTLAQRVKTDFPYSAMTYNSLVMHSRGIANNSSFYVLKDHPHSTVVLSLDHVERVICLHCCKSEVNLLAQALRKTSVIDWQESLKFRFVPDYLTDALQQVAREKHLQDMCVNKFHLFVHEPQEEIPLRCGKGLRVYRLGKAGVHHMAQVSGTKRGKFPLEQMLRLITSAPSAAVYLDPSSEQETTVDINNIPFAGDEKLPVCWVTTTLYGAIGFLVTEPEYRRRGLAKLVTQVVARLQKAQGYIPFCYTRPETVSFFKKMGDWQEAGLACVIREPDATGSPN